MRKESENYIANYEPITKSEASGNSRVLFVFAHHDDETEFAGGTIIKLAEFGQQVGIVVVTDGSRGTRTLSGKEITRVRNNEFIKTAEVLKAHPILLNNFVSEAIRDLGVRFQQEQVLYGLVKLFRQLNPRVVITHSLKDSESDHQITAEMVKEAVNRVGLPNELPNIPVHKEQNNIALYYVIPQFNRVGSGQIYLPRIIVDIREQIDLKINILKHNYPSQMNDTGHPTRIKAISRYLGILAAIKYGEGFDQDLSAWTDKTQKREAGFLGNIIPSGTVFINKNYPIHTNLFERG